MVMTSGVSGEPTSESPLSFSFRFRNYGSLVGAIPFVALDLFLISTGQLGLQIVGTGFLVLTATGLWMGYRVPQEVRLERNRLAVQMGMGPAFVIAYSEIRRVELAEWSKAWWARLGDRISSVVGMEYGYPYPRVHFVGRKFRLIWIPFPVPTVARTMVLPVWEPVELVNQLKARIV
jgi:hypothetical protein